MNRHQAARLVLLLAVVGSGGFGVVALAAPWLHPSGVAGPRGFAELAATTCALALVACWAWLAIGTVAVAVQALSSASRPSGRWLRWVPDTIRVLVPVLVGAAITAAPASASSEAGPATDDTAGIAAAGTVLPGLPLPDRVPTGGTVERTVLVRPGDSLWRITARLLPASAPASAVDRGWRRLARVNADRVADPDLILPGTRLRVPLTVDPREEPS